MTDVDRLKALSEDDRRAVAEEIVDDLLGAHAEKMPRRERAIEDIILCSRWSGMDGYEIAKYLDDTHHWECDLELAQALDGLSHILSVKLNAKATGGTP